MFEEFDRVSREEWLQKIADDLKGQAITDVHWHYDADLVVDPFVHSDDPGTATSYVPQTRSCKFGHVFHIAGNEAEVHQQITRALEGGSNALYLKVHGGADWTTLLEGVALEMIHTTIEIVDDNHKALTTDELTSALNVPADAEYLSVRTSQRSTPNTCHIGKSPTIVQGLATGLIKNMESDGPHDLILRIGPHYFVEIARMRALHILMANLDDALGRRRRKYAIEVHCDTSVLTAEPEQNMIMAGSMTLASVLGGAYRIFLSVTPPGEQPSLFQQRIVSNMHHLLQYESGIDTHADPVHGAYYIEKLTRQIVEKSWSYLISEIKKGGR